MKKLFFLPAFLVLITSCEDFLGHPSSSALTIPVSLDDCEALLNDYTKMNGNYPTDGEASADNYYLTNENWQYLSTTERQMYIWGPQAYPAYTQWLYPYQVIYNANLVSQTLSAITPASHEKERYEQIQGSAWFFRAYAYYELAQLFAPPYRINADNDALAIPLRLGADLDAPAPRATVGELYLQILADLEAAKPLLPEAPVLPTLPSVAAVNAMVARVSLTMGEYGKALDAATRAVDAGASLLDYNTIDDWGGASFERFNPEVVFHSTMQYSGQLSPFTALVDSLLIGEYASGDLRKTLYFLPNYDGTFAFRGSYDGTMNGTLFNGLTTAELYLIRAESLVRLGNVDDARQVLETLLRYRWKDNIYHAPPQLTTEEMLQLILQERRKELVLRGVRWTDLRRLNQYPSSSVVIVREIEGMRYSLPPDDPRYTLLFPVEAIETASLSQNER